MTEASDSRTAQTERELGDYCQVSHCRKESDLTFRRIGLCDRHWGAACQLGSVMEYLRDNLVEQALLALDWS